MAARGRGNGSREESMESPQWRASRLGSDKHMTRELATGSELETRAPWKPTVQGMGASISSLRHDDSNLSGLPQGTPRPQGEPGARTALPSQTLLSHNY